jgi:hypothetical protein
MKKFLVLLMAVSMLLGFCACGHEHIWLEATCTQPKTCSTCGKTEGEPLGHSWKDATCTEPKTCTVCGETEGEALGHQSAWKVTKEPTLLKSGEEEEYCSRCGEHLGTRQTDPKTIAYENGKFNFTSKEFRDYYENYMDYKISLRDTGEIDPMGGHAYGIMAGSSLVCVLSLVENDADEVETVMVWGDDEYCVAMGFITIEIITGIDSDDWPEGFEDELVTLKPCYLNGFEIKIVGEGSNYFSFRIQGE